MLLMGGWPIVVMADKARPYCMECASVVIKEETEAEEKAKAEKKDEPKAE